ncbi:methyltransferase type 12 [Microbacterium mangrovi]|uniref:Methyltransferase type 12 n=1 Tax=Microbacterium mangrovi TaxID=1348253 RepID=A0A0B2ABM0_9MICO|nr:methyltransferase type 12 [Microbacterium mangrovi]
MSWDSARKANLANWNDRVPLHVDGYGLDAFDDPDHISSVVADDLEALSPFLPGGVAGLDVCHLQCHIGTDTISFARRGARVTGLDFSRPALDAAAELADRHGIPATWVESDVLDARSVLEGDFDLVYTSIGTIVWLADLDRWAAQVAALLRPGGTFFIREGHPALYALDEYRDELVLRYNYFGDGSPLQWDEPGTYVGDGTVAHARTYQWPHPVSETVNALIGAGLRILRLDEGRTLPWRFADRMAEQGEDYVWPDGERDRVPCTYTVVARKV